MNDDLRPAKGIMVGVVIGSVIWAAIAFVFIEQYIGIRLPL